MNKLKKSIIAILTAVTIAITFVTPAFARSSVTSTTTAVSGSEIYIH